MSATQSINSPERAGVIAYRPVAAAVIIFAGTLVAINAAGFAVPAGNTAGLRVEGRAEETVDNSAGEAGDVFVNVKRGTFRFPNSATAAVDPDDVGKSAFVEDDQTVAETASNKVKAGRIVDVDDDGVWVDTRDLGPDYVPGVVVLTSTNGTAAAAADNTALRAEAELIGDDVRAIHAALVTAGILK